MIEGIIGLFVILFIALVAPYIKDWYLNTFHPEDIVKISVNPNGWSQTRRDGVVINHIDAQPQQPLIGDIWHNKETGNSYVWNGTEWTFWGKPQKGDIWFY